MLHGSGRASRSCLPGAAGFPIQLRGTYKTISLPLQTKPVHMRGRGEAGLGGTEDGVWFVPCSARGWDALPGSRLLAPLRRIAHPLPKGNGGRGAAAGSHLLHPVSHGGWRGIAHAEGDAFLSP